MKNKHSFSPIFSGTPIVNTPLHTCQKRETIIHILVVSLLGQHGIMRGKNQIVLLSRKH